MSAFYISCHKVDPRQVTQVVDPLDFDVYFDGHFYLPKGWKSTLWAESPQLYNPTNMDVDHRGRVWITEGVNYRDFNNAPGKFPHNHNGDRIVILEDTNHDGVADKSTVFAQDPDLVSPLGIAVLGEKIVVSCSPNLIIYTDEDGDDKPEKKEVLLTGFGGYDHDHSLHAVVPGPDGKWYFNTGNAGPHTVTDRDGWTLRSGSLYVGGSPYNTENSGSRISDDGRTWVGGLALRINPNGAGLEVLAHNFRNAYELAIDSYGDLWQNDNDDQVETCRSTWLMYGGNAGYFSADGTRTWKADQRPGQSVFTAHWHQEDPGVIPAGDNTGAGSPCGVLVYEGDAFGEDFRGMFLNVDAGRNTIFAYKPEMDGAGFSLTRRELISSVEESTEGYIWHELPEDKRKWFRPSDMVVGTDGSFYIADWYDPVVGGHQMHDTKAYGRIYRIAPEGKGLPSPVLDVTTTEGQLEALCSPAISVRNLGFRRLQKKRESVIGDVEKLLSGQNPFHRARAVWLLVTLGEEGHERVENVLRNEGDPRLRVAAYRALVQHFPDRLVHYAEISMKDPSPAVRRAVTISLRDQDLVNVKHILLTLYKHFDGRDPWYLEALGLALEGKGTSFYKEIASTQPDDPILWDSAFASLVWRLHPPSALPDLEERVMSSVLTFAERNRSLTAIAFTESENAAEAMIRISRNATDPRLKKLATYWVEFRRSNLWNKLIDWEQEGDKSSVPDSIIEAEKVLTDPHATHEEKLKAAIILAHDKYGGEKILSMAAAKTLPDNIYDQPEIVVALEKHPKQEVRILSGQFFSREDSGMTVTQILGHQGRHAEGQALFAEHCGTCHRVGEEGRDIGPDLNGIANKFDKAALADAILYPNGAVTFGYEPVIVNTKDKRVFSGFLLSEGETTVIKDLEGKLHTIPTDQVETKNLLDSSLMPDPGALGLTSQDVADVIAFLQRPLIQ